MYLKNLYLRNFRNYEQIEIEFSPRLNLIQGNNAQGKTNLLESIYFLGVGKSFRTTSILDLISYNKPFFFIEVSFCKDDLMQTIRASFDGQVKKVEYNNTTSTSFLSLLGLFPTVIIVPEDIELIIGSPSERRRFLDLHLVQIDPLYVHHLTRYHKAVKQRNFLLKKRDEEGIEVWEQIMLISASYIQKKRAELIEVLKDPLNEAMDKFSNGCDSCTIKYYPSQTEDYKKSRPKELKLGSTLFGPHRDDIQFFINEKEAKGFSSQGQKRCAVTALRLAEWKHFKQIHNSPPLLCIDDFGVHLDARRNELLLNEMQDLGQVFLTSPYEVKTKVDHLIEIRQGALLR